MIGIKSGMVMQRNPENVCDIRIQAAAMPPFAVYRGAAEGRAPIERWPKAPIGSVGFPPAGLTPSRWAIQSLNRSMWATSGFWPGNPTWRAWAI